jgi:hypothetical protein
MQGIAFFWRSGELGQINSFKSGNSFVATSQKPQGIYVLFRHSVKVIAKFGVTPLLCP